MLRSKCEPRCFLSNLVFVLLRFVNKYHYCEEQFLFNVQAIDFDAFEGEGDEAVTSSMVDDVFFIIQKSLR